MSKRLGLILMAGGLALGAGGAGAHLISKAGAVHPGLAGITPVPAPPVPLPLVLAQATKPMPPPRTERREETGPDGGSISGKRLAKPSSEPEATAIPVEVAPQPPRARRDIHVEAPSTDVRVNPSRGAVRVEAPYTFVDVNAERGRAVVRAPGVNLDIRW